MNELILELHNELITKEQEINRLKDIIREAREYLPKLRVSPSYELDDKIDNLLEILDKVGDSNE